MSKPDFSRACAQVLLCLFACTAWPTQAQMTAPVERLAPASAPAEGAAAPAPPERLPTDFERLATAANAGRPLWRFGTEPRVEQRGADTPESPTRVPADYPVQAGDELLVHVWGSVEGEWRLRVDRSGRIVLPRVGPVLLSWVLLAWPLARDGAELLGRLALALPVLVVWMLLDTPLVLLAEVWKLLLQADPEPALKALVLWSDLLRGGGRLGLPLLAGAAVVLAVHAINLRARSKPGWPSSVRRL